MNCEERRKFEYVDRIIKESYDNAEPISFNLPVRKTAKSARLRF